MNLYDAMQAVIQVQRSLAITRPRPVKIREAFLTFPAQATTLTSRLPAFTNSFTLIDADPRGSQLSQRYQVRMQLHVAEFNMGRTDEHAEIAIAFLDAIVTAFNQKDADGIGGMKLVADVDTDGVVTRQPTVQVAYLRGGNPTLVRLGDENGPRTLGLDLLLDMEMGHAFQAS